MTRTVRSASFRADVGFAVLTVLVLTLAGARATAPFSRPQPLSRHAPATAFSAARALQHVRALARKPRFLGSPENAAARAYVVRTLRTLGLRTHVQARTVAHVIGGSVVAGRPQNVVGRLRGSDGGDALLLAAHYDSVPTGPGASDDAAGVAAVLETLRALRAGPKLRNDVVALLTDGEETGLLGARAFVDGDPWARDVRAVLNFEARGTTGPSILFETSERDGFLVREFARVAPHPAADSVLTAFADLAPDNTDMRVFEEAGWAGLGFGFVGGAERYHTRLDTVASLDPRSLQHHGVYAVALARRLGNLPLDAVRADDRVFLRIGGELVTYSTQWAVPLALAAATAFAGVAALWVRRTRMRARRIALGFLTLPIAVFAAAVAVGLAWSLVLAVEPGEGAFLLGTPYDGSYYAFAFSALTVSVVAGTYALLRARLAAAEGALGALLWWLLLALASAFALPTASHVLTWPLLLALAGLATTLALRGKDRAWRFLALAATAVPGLILTGPAVYGIWAAAGLLNPSLLAIALGLVLGLLVPHLELVRAPGPWLLPAAAALLAAGVVAVALARASFDVDHPRPDSLFYALDADAGRAVWASYDRVTDTWTRRFLGRDPRRAPIAEYPPFGSAEFLQRRAPVVATPSAHVSLLRAETRPFGVRYRLRVRAPAATRLLVLAETSPVDVVGSSVGGRPVTGRAGGDAPIEYGDASDWTLGYWQPPPAGFLLTLTTRGNRPLRLAVTAAVPGLPPPARGFGPRPATVMPQAVFIDRSTLVSRRFTLRPRG